MKKNLFSAVLLVLCLCNGRGQELLSSREMIAVTPVVPEGLEMPDDARQLLKHKLLQAATQNGFGSISGDIALTANVVTTNKQVTGTVPEQYILSLEVSLMVVDAVSGTIVNEVNVPLKGISEDENKTMVSAIGFINPRRPNIRNFMSASRDKLLDYYTTRIPVLIEKAQSLAKRDAFDEALAVLAVVPESVKEYKAVSDQMVAIYLKKIDREGETLLRTAKAKMAQHDLTGALAELVKVNPSSASFAKADDMIETIRKKADDQEKMDMEQEMKQMEEARENLRKEQADNVMLEKMRIEAAKKAGDEYAKKNTPDMDSLVNKWFAEKFGKAADKQ